MWIRTITGNLVNSDQICSIEYINTFKQFYIETVGNYIPPPGRYLVAHTSDDKKHIIKTLSDDETVEDAEISLEFLQNKRNK